MKELARLLMQNIQIDFSGEITADRIRQCLREDDSRAARMLLARIIEDKGVDDMLLTVADCLRGELQGGINEDVIGRQLNLYGDS